jgi:DNA-binding NarL/FixJ family response regulator
MLPRRVLLLGLPRMLEDVITNAVEGQPDMHLVGRLDPNCDSLEELVDPALDVLITTLRNCETPCLCRSLIKHHPSTRVIGLSREGRRAILCELRPHIVSLGEVSQQTLLDAIREAPR